MKIRNLLHVIPLLLLAGAGPAPEVSGIYPHLAMFNDEPECGTGAVVPWAGRLWAVTYAPHAPAGSSDKLYEIGAGLERVVRPESVGGTPANRMVHRETGQLLIGPYVIDAKGGVRVIPPARMPGRLTGAARHLTEPAKKVYYATMEEGFYEVDVESLAVKELYRDGNVASDVAGPLLPGYHGKGLYSGQGRLVYANNGEHSELARSRPDIESGVLAEWDGRGWRVVRRNQFTEVTGPGGIEGNARPETDPVWSVGWDHRSLIVMVLDAGRWHSYRLPKSSHSYDGAHGWNTEWPRIRDVGERDLLMTMHGAFWRFPRDFSPRRSGGVAPRSNYLKVVGDFCRWGDRVVMGCDDAARSEFLNQRQAKGKIEGPGQSQSNLWFVKPGQLDGLGPVIGRGAVWLEESVRAGVASEPYLFGGYERRGLWLWHGGGGEVAFRVEVDRGGNGVWEGMQEVRVGSGAAEFVEFAEGERGSWLRVVADRDCAGVTAFFQYANADHRGAGLEEKFAALANADGGAAVGGLVRALGENRRVLGMAAVGPGGEDVGYYELDERLELRRRDDVAGGAAAIRKAVPMAGKGISVDAGSVVVVDDAGRRWRFPKGDAALDRPGAFGADRVCREVCTERDLLNLHGTFYELPAENAGGFAKVRPIATHNRLVHDYCSYRGLLVMTGVTDGAASSKHLVRSADGRAAVWVGAVDDLWELGKPVGRGGPWKDTDVRAGEVSDPYLMTGYDRRRIELSHAEPEAVRMTVELDVTGTGVWKAYRTFDVPAGESVRHEFAPAAGAYWVRVRAGRACRRATAWLTYE
jgi:hypothetical protein